MNLLDMPVRRPLAVSMIYVAIVILGLVAVQRLPVELIPNFQGDQINVSFYRAGSQPEFVEREILLPLQSRIAAIPDIEETYAQIRGSSGFLTITFEPGTDIKVRQYEVGRIAASVQRMQDRGTTSINVQTQNTGAAGASVKSIQVTGATEDVNTLHDLAETYIAPRLASVPGVSEAITSGGATRQVTITVDPKKLADFDLTSNDIQAAVRRAVTSYSYLGTTESENGKTVVVIDGRPPGLETIRNTRVRPDRSILIRHIADVEIGPARRESAFRVNAQPAVSISIFQEEGENVLRVGKAIDERLEEVLRSAASMGLQLRVSWDSAENIRESIDRLALLGLSGFVIALLVLYLFLRQWRAVAVVAIAVPISLLAALSLFYLFGYSINLITLFGLALSVGLIVDNSVVVYEAILRNLEHSLPVEEAVRAGLRRTVRAIAAASLTTAVVFLPAVIVDIDSTMLKQIVELLAVAMLSPVAASLLVAVGLVPVLAYRLAAPAAVQRVAEVHRKRRQRGGLTPPDRARVLLSGLLANALRRPASWIVGTVIAVILTLVAAVSWLIQSGGSEPQMADSVLMEVRFPEGSRSLESATTAVEPIERRLVNIEGVEAVETTVDSEGGTIRAFFVDRDIRPESLTVSFVREAANEVAEKRGGVAVFRPGEGGGGSSGRGTEGGGGGFGGSDPSYVVISGPDSSVVEQIVEDIQFRLESFDDLIEDVWPEVTQGTPELWVQPQHDRMEQFGVTLSDVTPFVGLIGQEGMRNQIDFVTSFGRELPVYIEREGSRESQSIVSDLSDLRIPTQSGVLPVPLFLTIRQMEPDPSIVHRDGRRELRAYYRFSDQVPETGPNRVAIQEQVDQAIREVPRPEGYTVETTDTEEEVEIGTQIVLLMVALLFLVLAFTFESLLLPVVVILSILLMLLGAVWVPLILGQPLSPMSLAGYIALFGLCVNPAILLIDRIQQKARDANWSPGAAALSAVKERTRPVLMASLTTICGLWPLAITTDAENEMWPPFATVVIGGLTTSALLTLLIIPVGYILLQKLDRMFGRVGPWLVIAWLVCVIGALAGLYLTELVTSIVWLAIVGILIGKVVLGLEIWILRRPEKIEPDTSDGPPLLDVRHLGKSFGLPGPIRRTITAYKEFADSVVERGGQVFVSRDVLERIAIFAILAGAAGLIAYQSSLTVWQVVFGLVASLFGIQILKELRRFRGKVTSSGMVQPGGIENFVAAVLPWSVLAIFFYLHIVRSVIDEGGISEDAFFPLVIAVIVATVQVVRRSAVRQILDNQPERATSGWLRHPRTMFRRWSRKVGGLDLPSSPVHALADVQFKVKRGMVGILGPNGSGKTTLLRQLAGILDPTRGAVHLGGVPLKRIQKYLARWIGYLPQDAGLPDRQTPRQYLLYFAALYELEPEIRDERVSQLLSEVGLDEKADDAIGSLSGGMRQRVAVARTLLRLPPIIIVDEPTVGLDPRERIRFRNLLSRLASERIVLFSTHVVEDVAIACERVLVLVKSRLWFDGAPSELAATAEGKVWELEMPAYEPWSLPSGSVLVAETPTPGENIIRRVLSDEQPSADASQLDATPEDGYLWLLEQTAVIAA